MDIHILGIIYFDYLILSLIIYEKYGTEDELLELISIPPDTVEQTNIIEEEKNVCNRFVAGLAALHLT